MAKSSFNTQPPEGGWNLTFRVFADHEVSTHSRPKAAGESGTGKTASMRFNTQPPEGG